MPPRMLKCDFCVSEFRKDGLAVHIRAKHMDDLVRHLVEDAKECSTSPILQFMKKQPANMIPIPSRIHDNTDYWFGVKPVMIEEKDDVSPYLRVEPNMKAHAEFLEEVMSKVSVIDYMAIQRELNVKSPEMKQLERALRDTTEHLLAVEEQFALYKEKTETELIAYKQTVEEMNDGKTTAMMRKEMESLQRLNRRYDERITVLTRDNDRLRKASEPVYRSEVEAMDTIKMEELYIQKIEALQKKLVKAHEELEAEKEKNRKIKDSTRKTEKDTEKIRAEREKVKREMKEAKKRMKALQKALSSSGSDSDSDSDDD